MAGGAGLHGNVLRQIIAHHVGLGFPVAALHVRQYALKHMLARYLASPVANIGKGDLLVAATVKNYIPLVTGEILPGRFQFELVVFGKRLQLGEIINIAAIPAFDNAFR